MEAANARFTNMGHRPEDQARLRGLQGHWIGIALADGSRIERCELVSAGRPGLRSIWVCIDGTDSFLPLAAIAEVWEVVPSSAGRTAAVARVVPAPAL